MGTPEVALRCTDPQGERKECPFYEAAIPNGGGGGVWSSTCAHLETPARFCMHARARQAAMVVLFDQMEDARYRSKHGDYEGDPRVGPTGSGKLVAHTGPCPIGPTGCSAIRRPKAGQTMGVYYWNGTGITGWTDDGWKQFEAEPFDESKGDRACGCAKCNNGVDVAREEWLRSNT